MVKHLKSLMDFFSNKKLFEKYFCFKKEYCLLKLDERKVALMFAFSQPFLHPNSAVKSPRKLEM